MCVCMYVDGLRPSNTDLSASGRDISASGRPPAVHLWVYTPTPASRVEVKLVWIVN